MTSFPDTETEFSFKVCEHSDCCSEGLYRAPKSRDNLYEYYWFCLDHVRAYNKAWNYCADMDEDDIEVEIRRSTTWERPTWPMGSANNSEDILRQTVYENAGFFGFKSDPPPRQLVKKSPEDKALTVLGLSAPTDIYSIKVRYRELVKRHHPDKNGGDPKAEEQLKKINQAFHTLKRAYNDKQN